MSEHRILIISHGHPELSKGGAEVAAYNLFTEYKKRFPGKVLFLARDAKTGGESFSYVQKSKDEILFYTNAHDYFTHTQLQKELLWKDLNNLLEKFQPTVVHFHHYIHIGIELLRIVKNLSSQPKVFLTLHEYGAICNNNGQMIKTNSNRQLCYNASPIDCHNCFKQTSAGEFLLREHFLKSFFEVVDAFVSPSEFLKDRYVKWGIPADKITVIENGQILPEEVVERDITEIKYKIQFGYFGQLNPYKGIDVLLEAFLLLPKAFRKQVRLNIFGANLHIQTTEFQEKINGLLARLDDCVVNYGPYESYQLTQLMNRVDYVMVPSIWWENSPMVIQEAFMHKRPVICSNIGGMAEKVINNVNGLYFNVRSAVDLSEKIKLVCNNRQLHKQFKNNIKVPLGTAECAEKHLEVYKIEEFAAV